MSATGLLSKIMEKRSTFEEFLDKLKGDTTPLLFYGAGALGEYYYKCFAEYGVNFTQIVVSDSYIARFAGKKFKERDIMSLSKALDVYGVSNVLLAFTLPNEQEFKTELLKTGKIKNVFIYDMVNNLFDDEVNLQYDFVLENINRYTRIYDELCDDISKDIMIRILNQRISGNTKYLGGFNFEDEPYFPEFISLSDDEVFIDCGAYTGDTAEVFVKHTAKAGVGYSKIYAFEPDIHNFLELKKLNIKDLICVNKGTWHKNDIIGFSSGRDNGSSVDEEADTTVPVVTIDSILDGKKATFIKMDIEGAELNALKGAEETIKRYRPKLAICAYHKKDDLLTIPEFIMSLNLGYRLFLRAYGNLTTDFIIYAC